MFVYNPNKLTTVIKYVNIFVFVFNYAGENKNIFPTLLASGRIKLPMERPPHHDTLYVVLRVHCAVLRIKAVFLDILCTIVAATIYSIHIHTYTKRVIVKCYHRTRI